MGSQSKLLDLHVSDLLNAQLPSHYDSTSLYDLVVFRCLPNEYNDPNNKKDSKINPINKEKESLQASIFHSMETQAIAFVIFDQVLISVHPNDCQILKQYSQRLCDAQPPQTVELRNASARFPSSPADLMLRLVSQIVDGFLALRRELTRQVDHWQTELLRPKSRSINWNSLLKARLFLHDLEEICEDQSTAIQDWMETLETWLTTQKSNQNNLDNLNNLKESISFNIHNEREHELLMVRSRDVLEHIERVMHHVRRLEHNAETTVQMHFSIQSNRTNDIMRTLTVLTAVFLPLNLIAGIFGMNFEFIPFVHFKSGFWWAILSMLLIAVFMILIFWRKRYLERTRVEH